jgi:hypothetical protein
MSIKINREWFMPTKHTFKMKPIEKAGEPKEVAEAIIDLIRDRKNWNVEKSYSTLYL